MEYLLSITFRTGIPALPFCHLTLTASRPLQPAYPRTLNTLGDHLRKKRLDLGLLQGEVAERLEVDKDSVYYWETNRYAPSLRVIPRIIQFLGYMPYDTSSTSLGERIVAMRHAMGMSQERLARDLRVDPTTLSRWERGEGKPFTKHMRKLTALPSSIADLRE